MERHTDNGVEKSEEQLRKEQAEKLIGFLEQVNAYEHVQNFLKGTESVPDFNTFKDYLIRINGIARNIPIKERREDGENVELRGFIESVNVPREEDKDGLLQHAYNAAPSISKQDVKYMLPAVINAIHLFADGNGRTSRTLHLLLREFPSATECYAEMRKALSEDGRYDSFDINPGTISGELEHEVLNRYGWKFKESGQLDTLGRIQSGIYTLELDKINKNSSEGKIATEFFRLYSGDVAYGLTAIHMLLGDDGVDSVSEVYDGVMRISPLKMANILSADQWKELVDNFYKLKKEHVEQLVNIFIEPEKYKSSDGSTTIKDYFVGRIENAVEV